MAIIEAFHDISFPSDLGFSLSKTIERNVEVQNFISGQERRNARKYHSKRVFTIGVGAKLFDDLAKVIEFFEARRGALIGFRWHDILDYKSCGSSVEISGNDQKIGIFDGTVFGFQLVKKYGQMVEDEQNYVRKITKPKIASVKIAVGNTQLISSLYDVNTLTGMINIKPEAGLNIGDEIYAGFEFDVPVRFAELKLHIDYKAFEAGEIAQILIIEILD